MQAYVYNWSVGMCSILRHVECENFFECVFVFVLPNDTHIGDCPVWINYFFLMTAEYFTVWI